MNTFIQQGCIKLIKSDSKDIYNVTKTLFFKLMPLFTFYSTKNPEKKFPQKLQNCFNIDNKKKWAI